MSEVRNRWEETIDVEEEITRVGDSLRERLTLELGDRGSLREELGVDLGTIGIWEHDPESRTITWDASCVSLLGISPSSCSYPEFLAAIADEDRHRVDAAFGDVLSSHLGQLGVEFATIDRGGVKRQLVAFARRAASETGGRIIGILRESAKSERSQAESEALLAEAIAARDAADAQKRTLERVLVDFTRQLLDSLGVVVRVSSALVTASEGLEPVHRDGFQTWLGVIVRQTTAHLPRMNQILDGSAMAVGKLQIVEGIVDVSALVDAAITSARLDAGAKHLKLEQHLGAQLGTMVGDEGRLLQVLQSLLANAIQFTPEGGNVDLWAWRTDSDIRLTVRDSGEGITQSLLPFVFDRYWQADPRSRGFGLGLAFVRHVVELHGGTVRASSPGRGQGAQFDIVLPIDHPLRRRWSNKPFYAATSSPLGGVRVLVAVADRDVRDFVARVLVHGGATVVRASSATEAFERMESERPDIVLSDLTLRTDNGAAFIRRLRMHRRRDLRGVAAVAMTDHNIADDRERALAASFERCVITPIDPADLVELLAEVAREHSRECDAEDVRILRSQ